MALLALVLQLAFLGLAFGLRTYLHHRKTGTTGFRVSARRSRAEVLGAGGITAAALASSISTVLHAFGAPALVALPEYAWLSWIGVALAVFGIALVLFAQSNMGSSWRIGVDPGETTGLVTGGLFGLTRNPIFLGMLSFWLGMALLALGVVSIAAFVIAFVAVEIQVRLVEEPYLARTHGAAYADYASRTGRLLPGIGRLHRPRRLQA